jgi:TRAP-type mannitol/chloroaromatic compound transport system substrate-binding protein
MSQGTVSHRAAAVAVLVALMVGLIGSLALRPPGHAPVTASGDEAAAAERFRWRVPAAFATNLPALGDTALYVHESLLATSGGAVRLDIFEPGELVPPFSITDAVRDNKVEAGYTWLGYDQGKIPASSLLGAVPFGMEPWEFMAWWYEGGGRELGEALYHRHNVHPLLCGITGPETAGWFRVPVRSLADLRGLKIRFAGIGGKVIARAGASVTMLPGGEIFQAWRKAPSTRRSTHCPSSIRCSASIASPPTTTTRAGISPPPRFTSSSICAAGNPSHLRAGPCWTRSAPPP